VNAVSFRSLEDTCVGSDHRLCFSSIIVTPQLRLPNSAKSTPSPDTPSCSSHYNIDARKELSTPPCGPAAQQNRPTLVMSSDLIDLKTQFVIYTQQHLSLSLQPYTSVSISLEGRTRPNTLLQLGLCLFLFHSFWLIL